MIPFLAKSFRMLHRVIGISTPEAGRNEAPFVLIWLGIVAGIFLFGWFLFYLMMNVF